MKQLREFWYEVPHQVKVLTNTRGVVFHEYFIDAATGAAWKIEDLLRIGRLIGIHEDEMIVEYDDWIDFSEKI